MKLRLFNKIKNRLFGLAKSLDGSFAITRANKFSESIYSVNLSTQNASEGSSYVSTTPTPGTGVVLLLQTAYSINNPSILIKNKGQTSTDKDIILKRIKLICTAAGNGNNVDCAMILDTGDKYSSGGALMVSKNTSTDSPASADTIADIRNSSVSGIGINTTTTGRLVYRSKIKSTAAVVGDEYVLLFGAEPGPESGSLSSAAASRNTNSVPPLIIAPNGNLAIHFWTAGATVAPTYELVIEYAER